VPGITNGSVTSAATCLALMEGSMTVFINNGGITRLNRDKTLDQGRVLGPGSLNVFCEDKRVSLAGDAIAAHAPCPIPAIHCAAFTTGSPNVIAGGITSPMSDLSVLNFNTTTPVIATAGVGYTGPVVFTSVTVNTGGSTSVESTAGLFQIVPGVSISTLPSNLTRESASTNDNIILVAEETISPLQPGVQKTTTWTIPAIISTAIPNYYIVAYDIDNVVGESQEGNNSSTLVSVTAT
tara:strand:- start:34 stop:747 length:714 start_codon:yes stop_codon:yes gene_type:complete